MKKYIFAIVITLSAFTLSEAQTKFGIKGGLNIANLAVNKDQIDDTKMKLGFTVGVFTQSPLLGLDWLMLQYSLLDFHL